MRTKPELNEVIHGERGMLKAVAVLLENQCLVSAVSLMFTTMDALAALTRPPHEPDTSKHVFVEWVSRYLAPETKLGCTALDLYAARCGVLHSYSAESKLGREGRVRRLIYEWECGPAADASAPLPENTLVIQVEVLHRALLDGVRGFLIDAETDRRAKQLVETHLPSMLCYKPCSRLEVTVAA